MHSGTTTGGLRRLDVRGLLTLGASLRFEGDFLVFLQRLKAVCTDFRKVSEQIFTACIRRNEAVALCIVEPLDSTGFHLLYPYQGDWRDRRHDVTLLRSSEAPQNVRLTHTLLLKLIGRRTL